MCARACICDRWSSRLVRSSCAEVMKHRIDLLEFDLPPVIRKDWRVRGRSLWAPLMSPLPSFWMRSGSPILTRSRMQPWLLVRIWWPHIAHLRPECGRPTSLCCALSILPQPIFCSLLTSSLQAAQTQACASLHGTNLARAYSPDPKFCV